MIEIRRLTIEDLNGLIKLLEQLWPDKSIDTDAVGGVIEKGLKNVYQVYICATDNEKLIGYCSLTIKNSLWMSANLGNIEELVVDSKYRNQGIGKLLMNEIEIIAKNHDCKRIELDSAFHRTKAHEFYEKLGFKKRACLFTKEIEI
ncbi:MAG: GNAT family N-acetyltransferase [Tannerellaceae bacterium]|jgi:ribosomal protein S18 acetylase RimI-like enzyme|nr:GNAT family N-acetyltransferase [Tannerellaceae bacterium]